MSIWDKLQNLSITTNNNGKGDQGRIQSQTKDHQLVDDKQTIETQTMIECVQDTIKTVVLAAEFYKAKELEEKTINSVSDTAIRSLNLLAFNCEELYNERDQYTLDLMQKQACDQFEKLQKDDIDTYNLIEPHRRFIALALNGQKNLRYKTRRVDSSSKPLFDHDAETINKVFSHAITQNQQFDKRQQEFAEPQKNHDLKKQHQSDYKKYQNNNEYKKPKKQQKEAVPKQSDLYFTQSGKQSKFVNKGAEIQKQAEQKEMDEDIYEPAPDVYETLEERQAEYDEVYPFNALWKLSSKNKFRVNSETVIKQPICCQILWPNDKQKVNRDKTVIKIVPCFPWNTQTISVKIDDLELNPMAIIKAEKKHIDESGQLGHKSIEDWRKEEPDDIDYTMNDADDRDEI